jgi:tape measure domain-containing protein
LQASLTETAAAAQKTEEALGGLDGTHKISLNDSAIQTARTEIDRLKTSMREQLSIDPTADTREAQRRIAQLQRSIRTLDAEAPVIPVKVEADTSSLDELKSHVAGLAAGGAGIAAAWKLTGLAADVETTQIALSSLTGSVQEGAQAFSDLQRFAATTPFELNEVTQAARSLLAAGVDASQLPDMLTDLGNAASAVGAPLAEVALVFQQMRTKGKVSNEELLQLAERGVPAYQALADAMGITVAQVQELATKGELGTKEIDLLGRSLGDMFPTAMSDQAASLNGQLSTLHDNVVQIGGQIGALFLPTVKDLTGSLNGLLGAVSSVTGKFQELPGPVKDTVGHFVVLTGIVSSAAFFGPKILAGLVAAKALIVGTGDAALLASAKLKTFGSVLLITAGLAGLGALSGKLEKTFGTDLNTSKLNQELLILANTGKVTGGMLDSLHSDLSGLRGDFFNLEDPVQKVGDLIVGWVPGVKSPLEASAENVAAIDTELANLVDSGNFTDATKLWQLFVDKGTDAGLTVDEIKDKFPAYARALDAATAAQDDGTDSMDAYTDRLARLSDRVENASTKFDRLKESFSALDDEMIDSRTLVSDAQGAIDDLAESLVTKGGIFNLDKQAGRDNFDNLVALAKTRSAQIKQTFEDDGRAAAVSQSKSFRQSMAQMLIDANIKPKRAWELINQVMSEPMELNVKLADIDLAGLRAKKARLLRDKEALVLPVKTASTPRAADEAALDIAKDLKPIDVKLHTVNTGIDEAKKILGDTANPKDDPRVAKIDAKVTDKSLGTAEDALNNFIHTERPTIKLEAEVTIKPIVLPNGLVMPEIVPKSVAPAPSLAPAPVVPGLRTAGAVMMTSPSDPWFGAHGRRGIVPGRTDQGGQQVTRLAPKSTPVAVYLDGVEIAHRIEARRAVAATSSTRRSA